MASVFPGSSSLNDITSTAITMSGLNLDTTQINMVSSGLSDVTATIDQTFNQFDSITKKIDQFFANPLASIIPVPKNEPLPVSKSNPTPPQVNDGPKKGEPSTPASSRRKVNSATAIGKSNADLTHTCDFTIELKLKACGKTFEVISKNWATTLSMKSIWAEASTIPFFDDIRMAYDTLKGWYDQVKNYVNQIKMYVKCMKQIIQAINQVVQFLATLPANLLAQLMDCITGFISMFKQAVTNTVNGLINDVAGSQNAESTKAGSATSSASTNLTNAQSQQSQHSSS